MESFPDHYAALGIDPTADQEVITAAYRALAKKFHPDTGSAAGTASPTRFAAIQEAYEVLGKPESRHRYDLELLEATKRELEAHLSARKRRLEHRTGMGSAPPPPERPDLGGIRPEPRQARRGAFGAGEERAPRQRGPFLVLALLVVAVLGGIAYALLRTPGEELKEPEIAALGEKAAPATSEPPAKSSKPPAPAEKPAAEAEAEPPLFGSSVTDPLPEPRRMEERAAETAAAPEPPPEPKAETVTEAEVPPLPPPIPKAKPDRAARPAAPAQPTERQALGGGPFTLVIYEEDFDGEVFTERADVAFASEARCERMGGATVSRRLAAYDGDLDQPRIWYECLSAAEMR